MRRVLSFAAVFAAGLAIGAGGVLASSSSPLAWLTISNRSGQALESVCFAEDRTGSHFCIDHPLAVGESAEVPMLARGELGYEISIRLADGRQLHREFYAEAGYRVRHEVSETGIGDEVSSFSLRP